MVRQRVVLTPAPRSRPNPNRVEVGDAEGVATK
jgi:hypothetical protein